MYDLIYSYILSAKYFSIFVLMALFPTEAVMPFVGYAAAHGHVTLTTAIVVGGAGSTIGSILMYSLARLFDQKKVYAFVGRYGGWLGISRKNSERAGRWFDHNAKVTVFIGKFIPGVRSAVTIAAGLQRMPFWSFVTYTTLGTFLATIIMTFIGYAVQLKFDELVAIISNYSSIATFTVIFLVIILLIRHKYRKNR